MFTIRLAGLDDFETYIRLYLRINDEHAAAHPELFRPTQLSPHTREEFAALLADPAHGIFVAELEGRSVAFVHIVVRDALPLPILTPRRFAVIDAISVDPACQRQGMGRALMDHAESWARTQGVQEVELNAFSFNRAALQLYAELGYHPLSQRMRKPLD